ncbi:Mur ligase family protein [Isobaculum melis]|uniref:Lipid II isoglutaminyl synthase (glutamine-hydrolyzing) subunit MurT n=1 Tax=Isobaculum melis TaxID=142588 RepID=A0A1H9SW12_9LACT|nr:Mur ligase family protein [Isobaculum melis]SER88579.1 UDP-N-acetylmuramoyl-L-alanyl-D-glutamate--2,6-diaminopimelate ligase [Isobaculum melis]
MGFKSSLAITAGKTTQWFLRTFSKGSGASMPGRMATKFDPAILATLSEGYDVILVTGTNGKTLTTALTYKVLKQKYDHVITNPTGANMVQGVTATFLEHYKRSKKQVKKLAVIEVDEASMVHVTKQLHPKAIVFTNVFRDQMDRYGEIYTTYRKMLDGAKQSPNATLVVNGDAPIFNSVKVANPVTYFGFDNQPDGEMLAHHNTDGILCPHCQHILHYKFITYTNLGKYYCPHCDFKRPELTYRLTEMTSLTNQSSDFTIDGHPFHMGIGGLYNIYNALAAYSVGRMFDVSPEQIAKGLQLDGQVFGRQEVIQIGDKKVTIVLVKNPVGLNQVIDMIALDPEPFSLSTILNAQYADGIDVSWIWDAQFETLPTLNIAQYTVSGERYQDLKLRLEVAGIPEDELIIKEDLEALVASFKDAPTKNIYVLATYTAVINLRKVLTEQGFLKGGQAE